MIVFSFDFIFWWDWGFKLKASTSKAGTQPLEPRLQYILLWLLGGWCLTKYLPALASNNDPSNLSSN
jgi:hypothetical protein